MRFWFAFALNLLKQNYELRGVSSLKKMPPETRNEFMLQCFHLIQVSKNSNPVWLENSAVSARLKPVENNEFEAAPSARRRFN